MVNVVGQPTHELLVQEAVVTSALEILPPAHGRQLRVLTEVPARFGRADVIVLHVCEKTLWQSLKISCRFSSETECKVVAEKLENPDASASEIAGILGLSSGYVQRILAWINQSGGINQVSLEMLSQVVHSAWVIEAKVRNWRVAFTQAHRYRGMVSGVAVAMPSTAMGPVDIDYATRMGIGLISVNGNDTTWLQKPTEAPLEMGQRLWLGELAQRSFS